MVLLIMINCARIITQGYIQMRRKKMMGAMAKKVASLVPYHIVTLYQEEADFLNSIPSRCMPVVNKLILQQKLVRLRLTASQAQCAVLTSNQINIGQRMFVVHKDAGKLNKWISEEYQDPSKYQCYMNASILRASQPENCYEESVAFPFVVADIKRYKNIEVEFLDFDGQNKKTEMEGFQAFAFQQAWDYSVGRHMLDWRLHHGSLRIQDDIRDKLPKTASVMEQYSRQLKAVFHKYPKLTQMPEKLEGSEVKWLVERGYKDQISIEADFLTRIHRHYRKEMLLLLSKLEHNIL